ncbi:MAG: alanine dehydrogenase [Pseudomonadota bacterium]|nr:alanine dehydrogenase [Pseudomonadota bacterium]
MQKVGIPTEIKPFEKRVALTPDACEKLTSQGVEVHVQSGAGLGAGFEDDSYQAAGCLLQPTAADLYKNAELIVKVKEPLEGDLTHLNSKHLLFCYLHLASSPELVEALLEKKIKSVAFETVVEDGKTPLLAPMSAIAGRLATQIATWHLHAQRGGNGTLLGGIHGKPTGHVLVVGAGVAGTEAARLAYGMGAQVTVVDINPQRLETLKAEMPKLHTDTSNDETILKYAQTADALVGAVYVVGKKAPTVVKQQHVAAMAKGSIVVDISIDQGGCVATSKPCSHDKPVYEVEGVLHSAITNLPAAAPKTASEILSQSILPYVENLAQNNWTTTLSQAINTEDGQLKVEL